MADLPLVVPPVVPAPIAISNEVAQSAVRQVRRSITLLRSLRTAESGPTIDGMIRDVHNQLKLLVLPPQELLDHIQVLKELLSAQILRIRELPKLMRGALPKNSLPNSLVPLEVELQNWEANDQWFTGLTEEINSVLYNEQARFAVMTEQKVEPGNGEYQYHFDTVKIQRLLQVLGEVRGLCAAYQPAPQAGIDHLNNSMVQLENLSVSGDLAPAPPGTP